MAHIEEHVADVGVESPYLVEGLPGVGLVGKIAVDHLVSEWDMTHVASAHCEGIPNVSVYRDGAYDLAPPVRIYADSERDVLALQSDVPVSAEAATEFAGCVTEWYAGYDATPICLVGIAADKDGVPDVFGVATGDGADMLSSHDIQPPGDSGMVAGPTGALLSEADGRGIAGVGLVVESNPQFPDPEAARVLLTSGIGPIAGVEVDTEALVEQAEEIADARERLAQRMQEATEESSRAQPVGMYQ
ncbi:MAG: proteasome assembly chaperone family protein [Salinirussus sp.]